MHREQVPEASRSRILGEQVADRVAQTQLRSVGQLGDFASVGSEVTVVFVLGEDGEADEVMEVGVAIISFELSDDDQEKDRIY